MYALIIRRIALICVSVVCFVALVTAQTTLHGHVINFDTKEPVAFASVWVQSTTKGSLTQIDGSFTLEDVRSKDTLLISSLGYLDLQIPIAHIQKPIVFQLVPTAIVLEPTVIRPGPNPAIPIVRNAIRSRRDNRPDRIEDIQYMEYNKLNISFSQLDSSIFQTNIFRNNPEILIKAHEYDSTWSIPLFFSERLTLETRESNTTPLSQEVASNQYGSAFINSDIVTKYIQSLNRDISFYGNLRFLSRDFISPISTQAFLYYDFFLRDSILFDGSVYYQIRFRPKNKQDLCFNGVMIIEKDTWALTEIQATLQPTANVNYVTQMHLQEKLQKHKNTHWFYSNQSIEIEFSPQLTQDTSARINTPLRVLKTTTYIIDSSQIQKFREEHIVPTRFAMFQTERPRDTLLLSQFRPEALTSLDIQTRNAIEISNAIPAIKATNKMLDMFLYGYLPLGKIELGPYLYFVQHNEIEGYRLNLAARTSPLFHTKMMLGGYLGYGLRDKTYKFGGTYALRMPTQLLGILHVRYDQNIYRIGDYRQNLDFVRENVLVQSDDNMLSALTSKNPNKAVYFVKKASLAYEQQITPNLIVKPKLEFSEHYNSPFYNFDTVSNAIASFSVQDVSCNFRFSFDEEISNNHFRRMYIDSKYPIIHANILYGRYAYGNLSSEYFSQLRLVVNHDILLGVGRIRYVIESGLTSAPVPFPLVEFHRGNETGSSGEYYFNLMQYLEFASDRFVNIFAEYSMSGFIFNKIPGIRRLQFRELLTFKSCWGAMEHSHLLSFPEYTKTPVVPYIEAGVGITNVLKLIRIEYIWRLNHVLESNENSGLFFRFQFEF